MLFRCQAILERRRKERIASDEAIEEADYINEATEAAVAEAQAEAASEKPAPSAEKPAQSPQQAEKHKRTQKDAPETQVSSHEEAKNAAETPAADAKSDPNPRGSA
jgi:hypothetical protein